MEENLNEAVLQATTPKTQDDFKLSVRFNKEDVDLDYDSAVMLTQKGMKFELIEDDFRRIKELAKKDGKSLSQYITALEESNAEAHKSNLMDMCDGNEELCSKILELEHANENQGSDALGEIRENFPEIDSIEKLPEQVVASSELRGSNLLDEYLRYLLKTSKLKEQTQEQMKAADSLSIGSQGGTAAVCDSTQNEFIKGIWSRN